MRTGNGDTPAAVAADVPAVGDYYFPHPESGCQCSRPPRASRSRRRVDRSANTQTLAMNGTGIRFGLSSNASHRSAADVTLDSLGFDETAPWRGLL